MANQPTPTKPATIKDVIVPGNNDSGCTRACNGNSTCGGVCGGQCYKQVHTDQRGVDTVMGYSCRGTGEIVDPLPRPLPKTIAALLSTVGSSPQQDVFEAGSSPVYAQSYTIWNLASADNNSCTCNNGAGCERATREQPNKCGSGDYYKCYSLLPISYESGGKFTIYQSFFACIQDRLVYVGTSPTDFRPLLQRQPWPDGEYTDDPRGNSSSRRREDGAKPVFKNPNGLGSAQL